MGSTSFGCRHGEEEPELSQMVGMDSEREEESELYIEDALVPAGGTSRY